ncbi:MAG: hypothetical protein ABSE73_11505 [Planctomycetota bacterium]
MTTSLKAFEAEEMLSIELPKVMRRQERAETAVPVAEAVEGRSFYIVTTLLGGVMFLLAVFACFIMSQTLLLR